MTTLTLESLGLTREEITERVVEKVAEQMLAEAEVVADEDDGKVRLTLSFAETLKRKVLERVNMAVDDVAAKNILPNVAAYVEGLCLQETNKWGEKVGKPLTFVEYLVSRAEHYLREEVSFEGKARSEDTYVSWRASGTRIAYLVHKHLQYSIQSAMEKALKDANSKIVGGIEEAVKIKLAEVAALLKVETKIGR